MIRIAFISGALLGLLGVIAGAMGAHALENVLTPDKLESYKTAVRFQMYHAFFLLVMGLIASKFPGEGALQVAIWGGLIGTLLFSGSIYLLVLTPVKVGIVTPIGGLILIAGWAAVLFWALRTEFIG